MADLATRAIQAVRDYELWHAAVERLTQAIADCWCPNEPGPHRDDAPDPADWALYNEYTSGASCFHDAREDEANWIPDHDDGSRRPPSLDVIAKIVADCPSCSRLCELIAERKAAKVRRGVAKRAVRHVGKLVLAEEVEHG